MIASFRGRFFSPESNDEDWAITVGLETFGADEGGDCGALSFDDLVDFFRYEVRFDCVEMAKAAYTDL